MAIRKRLVLLRGSLVVLSALGVCAFVARPLNPPVAEAQGRPDLEAQHQRMLPLFELAGVVFTDADEARGRLVVGVLDRDVEGLVRARLRVLGIQADSVDVVETAPIFQLATLRDRAPSVVAGLQIRFSQFLCSLGFNAINANGVSGFVTASHCSDRQGTVDGTTYYQPLDQVAADLIGTEVADPAYVRNSAGCPKGRKCRRSDANFSRGDGPRLFTLGAIARTTGIGSLTIDPAHPTFTITGDGIATLGSTVNKIGRTTGWTQGSVTGTCVNTGVSGTSIVLLCQTFVESNSVIVGGGDSGSPVFATAGGDNVTLLGDLWGGNADGTQFVYSPIANIEAELGSLTTH
jgi:hypothetical protein